jgi:dGTP triphosphohydrolase
MDGGNADYAWNKNLPWHRAQVQRCAILRNLNSRAYIPICPSEIYFGPAILIMKLWSVPYFCLMIETSRKRIGSAVPKSIDEVRAQKKSLIGFGEEMAGHTTELKRFLHKRLYEHPRVQEMTENAQRMVQNLFEAYFGDVSLMPAEFAARAKQEEQEKGESGRARIVADYVAGMTDRYATKEYQRINT